MTVSNLDLYRAASMLIERYGERVELEAAKRHADVLVDDDTDGARVWSLIRRAIKELQGTGRCIDCNYSTTAMDKETVATTASPGCRHWLRAVPNEARYAAQRDLLTEAFMYRMCLSQLDGFAWPDCANIRRSLDQHLAAFKARYAPGY